MIKINRGHLEIEGNAAQIQAELTTLLLGFAESDNEILNKMVVHSFEKVAERVKEKAGEAL